MRTSRSLYERANGYSHDALKIFMPAGAKQPVVVHYVEHMPPDVTAGIFWLKNRDPENWRDVQNVDHVLGKYIISDRPMTEEAGSEQLSSTRRPSSSSIQNLTNCRHQRNRNELWVDMWTSAAARI